MERISRLLLVLYCALSFGAHVSSHQKASQGRDFSAGMRRPAALGCRQTSARRRSDQQEGLPAGAGVSLLMNKQFQNICTDRWTLWLSLPLLDVLGVFYKCVTTPGPRCRLISINLQGAPTINTSICCCPHLSKLNEHHIRNCSLELG